MRCWVSWAQRSGPHDALVVAIERGAVGMKVGAGAGGGLTVHSNVEHCAALRACRASDPVTGVSW